MIGRVVERLFSAVAIDQYKHQLLKG